MLLDRGFGRFTTDGLEAKLAIATPIGEHTTSGFQLSEAGRRMQLEAYQELLQA